MPKISIIVPVYQVEKYLRRCLDSIVAQTFTDWECILVDDGSPDNSGKICDEYAEIDNRFRVFHQENAGVSAARNKGLDEAKGEWITFVDSDDYIEEDYLQSFNPDELENGSLYVHSNYYREEKYQTKVFGIAENELKRICDCTDTKILYAYLEKNSGGLLLGPCMKLFQQSVIKSNNLLFDVRFSFGEDNLFVLSYLSCSQINKIIVKNYCGYRYTNNENSLSHHKVRHPKICVLYSEEEHRLIEKVVKNLEITDIIFTNYFLNKSQIHLFGALHHMYLVIPKITSKERKKIIKNLKDQLYEKYKLHHKLSKRNSLYRFLLMYLPISMIDIFMKIIIKLKYHSWFKKN